MKLNKTHLIIFTAALAMNSMNTFGQENNEINIIPKPVEVKVNPGSFLLTADTKIIFNKGAEEVAVYLEDIISKETGLSLSTKNSSSSVKSNVIELNISDETNTGQEGYRLSVISEKINITGSKAQGLFYGIQTLRQMYLDKIDTHNKSHEIKINCAVIKDQPRFGWRGLNLDCCRHFMTKDFVKRYIDLLAFHKMNVFHWHLTEDQGWRIEIKKYPKLTGTGAWRDSKDGNKYGGFYTQEDVKEVLEYARSRFITVVPEIEMPGHSLASLASYPENSCSGGPFEVGTQWGVIKDIYCAGNEGTFKFIEDVLTEVIQLFPGKYIHIGGDEAPKDRWKVCPKCQARIKAEGLKDENELQSYFVKRIEKFLSSKGKKLVGWDEILEGGLAPGATVQSWRGVDGAIAAAKSGHDAIVSPYNYTYFNSSLVETDLRKAYSFEPVPAELTSAESKFIIGSEANMWTEIAPQETIDSKLFPRILALAEVVWSDKNQKNYDDFINRVQNHYKILDALGVNYGAEAKPLSITPVYDYEKNIIKVKLKSGQKNADVFYTLDGSYPSENSNKYTSEIIIEKSKTLKAVSVKNKKALGEVVSQNFIYHKATGKKIELLNNYTEKYSGGGKTALIDGMRGTSSFNDGFWQGYEEIDFSGIIDLGKETEINTISAGFLQNNGSWIFLPQSVSFSSSKDGKSFTLLGEAKNDISPKLPDIIQKDFSIAKTVTARYIKVDAKSLGICPTWHPGAGGKAWLFMDEITID